MGTNANLPGKQDGNHGGSSSAQGGGGGIGGDTPSSGVKSSNGAAAMAASIQALKHDPGIAVDWTVEEQATLEEMSSKYASDPPVVRYAKIAKHLPEKTVRDVALRSRWMTKKESGKRRKDDSLSRKSKDKKERATDSSGKPSHIAARHNVPPYAMPILPMENDDDISCKAIGGPSGQLLEHTAQIFNQISGNFNSLQINDNISLFCQARDNILNILNELDDIPGVMKQMPPLPVKLNEDLANTILPSTILPRTPMPPSS